MITMNLTDKVARRVRGALEDASESDPIIAAVYYEIDRALRRPAVRQKHRVNHTQIKRITGEQDD